jgi:hypothetical protein
VNYAKLLEMNSFFTWNIFLEVGNTQDLPSKIWQTLGDAGANPPQPHPSRYLIIINYINSTRPTLFNLLPTQPTPLCVGGVGYSYLFILLVVH